MISIDKNIKEFDRFILLSDIHFGVRSNSIEWIENIKDYFYNFFIPNVKKLSNNYKTSIIIAGDVFDNRQSLDIDVMNSAQEIIKDVLNINKNIQIYCILGNHDLYRKHKTDEKIRTSLKCLDINRFNIILDNKCVELKNSMKLLFVPWIGNTKTENEIVKKTDADIIIMHTDINGAVYDNGRPITNGVNINLTNAKKIYSGHIHKRQESDRRTYIGTPYQTKRSDIGNDKGIYYITLTDDGFVEDFILNDYSPKYIREKIEDLAELTMDELKPIFNNNYVDIVIKDIYLKDFSISKLIDALKDFSYKKVEVIVDKTDKKVISGEFNFDDNISIDNYIEMHIKNMEGVPKTDIEEMLKINTEYVRQYFNE